MHNHWHVDLDRDGTIDTMTASAEGIHVISKRASGWIKTQISRGAEGDGPETSGAGEIKVARLASGQTLVATIEPMHGQQVVVYAPLRDGDPNAGWNRIVIDDSLQRGHALWAADLDRDGSDELIVGHSDVGPGPIKGPGLYAYDCQDASGTNWEKHVLDDGGIATEDAVVADLNGDGWLDIVAGGRATQNVKIYFNRGQTNSK
jgi:hypothetical protein